MIKSILFDLDGVLVNACEWHYEALNQALFSVCGEKIEREEHNKKFNGLPTSKKLEILHEEGRLIKDNFRKVWNLKQLLTEDVINKCAKKDEEKIYMLSQLVTDGYKVGCVTNSIKKSAQLMLKKTGQFDFLEIIITNEDVVNPKPDPEGYLMAMSAFGFNAAETLIIEDSYKGQKAALATGAHLIKVNDASEVTLKLLQGYMSNLK